MIPFVKMHGCGNDYIFINGFETVVEDPAAFSRAVSDRHSGIGSDGVILINPPDDSANAARMRMFNADGSEAEMCGNGIRCVCAFVHAAGIDQSQPMRIETGAGVLDLTWDANAEGLVESVTVDMGQPSFDPGAIPYAATDPVVEQVIAELGGADARCRSWRGTLVSMGNPHLVVFIDNVAACPLHEIGPVVEHASIFPERINVHVVESTSPDSARMRTWERGAGLTQACGTGAAAVVAAGVAGGRLNRVVNVDVPGGRLRLRWDESTGHMFKTGPATAVYSGVWSPVTNALMIGAASSTMFARQI
ncbi:MAG: diaminopimelate epimerase [Planctomycetota bacterium]